jgi:hypothetical protein
MGSMGVVEVGISGEGGGWGGEDPVITVSGYGCATKIGDG